VEKESREHGDGYSRFLSVEQHGLTPLKALVLPSTQYMKDVPRSMQNSWLLRLQFNLAQTDP
jgi:hypothetical protein